LTVTFWNPWAAGVVGRTPRSSWVTAFLLGELTANSEAKSAMTPISQDLPRVSYRTVGY